MRFDRLLTICVLILIGLAFATAGPAEQALERSCLTYAPTARACARF